ncbi:MAG: hypothetical protein C0518_08495 [Opitutus sp.]|nr:hypothetical protein [Opitutus sp.]
MNAMSSTMLSVAVLAAWSLAPQATANEVSRPPAAFSVLVVPTVQHAHDDIWARTPNGRGPATAGVGTVLRGQPVHVLVFTTGFALSGDGFAEASYRVRSIRPDGSPGAASDELRLIPRLALGNAQQVRKAADYIGWVAEKEDALGEWTIKVEATDKVSGATAQHAVKFNVVDNEILAAPLPADTEIGQWLMRYHLRPVPHELLAAFRHVAAQPPSNRKPRPDHEDGAWLGFVEQVLADNAWLLPHFVARLEHAMGRERELLAVALAYAKRDDPKFIAELPVSIRAGVAAHAPTVWPTAAVGPLTPSYLDVLWGRFFASARFAPLHELTGFLAFHPFKDALDDYGKSDPKPFPIPSDAYKSATFRAAVWSLRSNIEQHKTVRDYCEGILIRKELPEDQLPWLGAMFNAAVKRPSSLK